MQRQLHHVEIGRIKKKCKVLYLFDVFLTVHHSIDFSKYQLRAQFF